MDFTFKIINNNKNFALELKKKLGTRTQVQVGLMKAHDLTTKYE